MVEIRSVHKCVRRKKASPYLFLLLLLLFVCFVLQFSESFQNSTSEDYLSGKCVLSLELAVNPGTLLYLLNYQIFAFIL